jgi:hypothetical protein
MGDLYLHKTWNNVTWISSMRTPILFLPYNPQCVIEWEWWRIESIDLICNTVVSSGFLYFGFHPLPLLSLSLSLSLILIPTFLEEFGISGYNSLRFLWSDVIFQDPRPEVETGEEERLLVSSPPLPLHYASQTRGFYHREFCIRLINLRVKERIIILYQTRINRSTINTYLRHYVISTACLITSLQPRNWEQWVQKPPMAKLKFMVIRYCQVGISPYPKLRNVADIYYVKLHFTSVLCYPSFYHGSVIQRTTWLIFCREFLYFLHHVLSHVCRQTS